MTLLIQGCDSATGSSSQLTERSTLLDEQAAVVPPGIVVRVSGCIGNAANDTSIVNAAGTAAGAGNTVQFANGQRCVVNSMTLKSGVYYYVPNGQLATLVAASTPTNLTFTNNVTMNGLSTCNLTLIADNTSFVTIGNSTIGSASCQQNKIIANSARNMTIINNNFVYSSELTILSYRPNNMNIDGNYFTDCKQDCIGMPYGAGNGSTIQRNVFQNTYKAVMEIGFDEQNAPEGPLSTTNFKVINNWSNLSKTPPKHITGTAWSYQLAYSIPLNGPQSRDNLIANNYADGTTPYGNSEGICIEISGSGIVRDNQCSNFNFGAIGYGSCSTTKVYTNNNFSEAIWGAVASYNGCAVGSSSMQISGATTNHRAVPARPTRVSWGGRN